jgi:hypothetical protein
VKEILLKGSLQNNWIEQSIASVQISEKHVHISVLGGIQPAQDDSSSGLKPEEKHASTE